MSSTRLGTRISSRVNKLAGRMVADRDTIQQICDQQNTRKLMTWLDTILQDETLTEVEYEKYQEMEDSEIEDLLSVEDIKLPSLKNNKEHLETEIAQLKQQLVECEQRESVITKQHAILSSQSQKVWEQTVKTSTRLESDSSSINNQAASKVLQHRFQEQLSQLDSAIKDHIKLHEQDSECAKFISCLPLDQYIKSELEYTHALGAYTQKLFFPGISCVPGNPKECELVGLDDSENKENKRYSQGQSYKKIKDTVHIVKAAYIASQEENIAETVNFAANRAKIDTLKDLISKVINEKYPKDEATLTRMAEEFSLKCVRKENDIKLVWNKDVLPLLEELKNLQDVSILCGNYNLKLARQNYFMSRQDKIIDNLISQLSRQELLQILLADELRSHHENVGTLKDVLAHITQLSRTMEEQERLVSGDDAILPVKSDKLCIGTNDKTLNCALELLKSYIKQDTHKIFFTFENLEDAIKRAMADQVQANDAMTRAKTKVSEIVSTLDTNVSRCSRCLEKGFTSTIIEEDKLTNSLDELELIASSLKDEYNDKSQMIRNNESLSIGRKLFVYFFTDPDRLREVVGTK